MSSSVTITDEMIAEIANRMADEGQKISPLAIWSEVHTGSVVAVAAALRKWRETRALRAPQVAERPALPEVVTDTMRDALDRLWTSAQDEAERAVSRRLSAMTQRVEDASNERDDALAELQNTVEELETGRRQLVEMTDAYHAKADEAGRLAEDIALAVQRTDAAELLAQALAARVAALEAEVERLTAELAAEREAHSRQEADASASSIPTDDALAHAASDAANSEQVARLESELEAIRAVLEAEQQAHTAQTEEASRARAELDCAARDLQEAHAQLATLAEARNADASEIARLSATLSAAQERAEVLQQHATELAARATAPNGAVEAPGAAAPAGVDAQEVDALKLQISRDAQAHAAALAEARENMKKWSEYANGLKQQLAQANEKMIVINARGAGEASLSRKLATELSRLQPEHELLRREYQQQLIVESISAQLEQQGYRYDPKTGVVSKQTAE
ncbi:DNA-binding protein [Trinickia mobilis]|uniref:DNA-binding protein n=1 Tax=Trinickia mobilis TaxID=2816356 RepID=UPI001A8C2202|nr:DNA-binding protein [Trinickia mobilis]